MTPRTTLRHRAAPATLTAIAVAVALSACGSSGSTSSTPAPASSAAPSSSAAPTSSAASPESSAPTMSPSMSSSASSPNSSASSSSPSKAPAAAAKVSIKDFQYAVPPSVAPGATITVMNADSTAHTVTADGAGGFDVKVDGSGTATFTAPSKPGSYPFHCTFHSNMHGILVVK